MKVQGSRFGVRSSAALVSGFWTDLLLAVVSSVALVIVVVLAFAGPPESAAWLSRQEAEALLDAEPAGNIVPELQRDALERVLFP